MVYKNSDYLKFKITAKNYLFVLIFILYFSGLCIGSNFAFKNSYNIAFVEKISAIENIIKTDKNSIYAGLWQYFKRDIILCCSVLLMKYAGVLKGLALSVPFTVAVQNSCIYASRICSSKMSVFNLFFHYIIKDTAVIMVLLLYTYAITTEILAARYKVKHDVITLLIYISAIIMIYIIYIAVRLLI